jgi:hypothetical protein
MLRSLAVQPRWVQCPQWINRIAAAALIGTLLAGAAPAYADSGNDLVNVCQGLDRPFSSWPDGDYFKQGTCSGYAEAAFDAIVLMQSAVWPEKLICIPKDGLSHGVTTEIFARYLVNHPEQRHMPGIVLMGEALKAAFPCKRG